MSAKSALQICLTAFMGVQMKWADVSATGCDLLFYGPLTLCKQMK